MAIAKQLKGQASLKVFRTDGRLIFEGIPKEVATFWSSGVARLEELASFADAEGKTIVRFGATDEHDFVYRERVRLIVGALAMLIEEEEDANEPKVEGVLTEAEKGVEFRRCNEVFNSVGLKYRGELKDVLDIMSMGIDPETQERVFEPVSGEVGRNFNAHGIAKTNQLAFLLSLLETGIDPNKPFSTAPFDLRDEERAGGSLTGTGGGTCYKNGIAVLTGGYKQGLEEFGIKHVFINDVYAELVEPLKKLFPQYQIHLLSEQKAVLEAEVPPSDLRDAQG